MKKVYCLMIYVALILTMTSVTQLSGKNRRTKRKKTKKEVSGPVIQSSLLSVSNSLENGTMTDLFKDAQDKAQQLEEEVSEKTKLLNQRAEERYRMMQEEIAKRTQEIQEMAKKQSEELANRFKEEARLVQTEVQQTSTALRKQAAQQVVSLFNQAEEEAIRRKREAEEEALKKKRALEEEELRRRREEREKLLAKKLEQSLEKQPITTSSLLGVDSFTPLGISLTRVDSSWKEKTSQEFHTNMALMKKIILEGETESEAQDFMKRFSRQSRWFDTSLGNTTYVCDEHYKEIVKRSNRLRNVVQAQKSADQFLEVIAKEKDLTSDEVKKIRLGVLYELNAQINRIDANGKHTDIDDAKIKRIITQVIKETLSDTENKPPQLIAIRRPESSSVQDVTPTIPLAVSSTIQNDLETLAQEIKDLKNVLAREVKKRKKTKLKVKEKDARIIELEQRLAQAQENITRYKNQITNTGSKLALEVQQTEQTKAIRQENSATINKLQEELDQAKQEVEQITGKASTKLSSMKQEIDALTSSESELRKKFAQSLEQEKKTNLELERKTAEVLEENKSLSKRLSRSQKEKDDAVTQAKQQFKNRFEGVNKQLITKEIDIQQAQNKNLNLEEKVKNADQKILQLTQDKLNLIQEKDRTIQQTKEELSRKFKNKIQHSEASNIELQIEQRKAGNTIAHLTDKVRQSEQELEEKVKNADQKILQLTQDKLNLIQEKDRTIQQTKEELSRKFKNKIQHSEASNIELQIEQRKAGNTIAHLTDKVRQSEQEKNQAINEAKKDLEETFQKTLKEKEQEKQILQKNLQTQAQKTQKDLLELKEKAHQEQEAAVQQAKQEITAAFKPRLEEKEKNNLELEITARKALEETSKVKSDLIAAYKEKDEAVDQAKKRLTQRFRPQLEQASREKLEAEIQVGTATNKSNQLEKKVKILEESDRATKNGAKSLVEKSNKQALAHEIEVNQLKTQVQKTSANSIPMDLLDFPTLEMLDQRLNNK